MDYRTLWLDNGAQPGIRIAFLRAVHAALLAELPGDGVLEFWARHPLVLFKGALPPKAFLRHLWESDASVPPGYFWNVLQDLQAFLEGKGLRPEAFFRLLNQGAAGGPPLDPNWVLATLPVPENGNADARDWLLTGLAHLVKRMFPGCRMERIPADPTPSRADVSIRSALFLFLPLARYRRMAAPEFRLFPGLLLQALPRLFGCSAFDRLDVLAELRGPGAILTGDFGEGWNWKGDALLLGKRRMGRLEPMERFIESLPETGALRTVLPGYLACPVLRMERDFRPTGSRSPLLRAGCAYGAPAALARIGYSRNRRWMRLASLLKRIPSGRADPLPAWDMAEILHRGLLDALD